MSLPSPARWRWSLVSALTPAARHSSNTVSLHALSVQGKRNMVSGAFDACPTSAYVHIPFGRRRRLYCDFTIVALGKQERGKEHDEEMELAEKRKLNRKYVFDIFNSTKKGESFSNVQCKRFYSIMDIQINDLLSSKIPIVGVSVQKSDVDKVCQVASALFHSEGNPDTGNEAKRGDFIHPFLYFPVAAHNCLDKINRLWLEREYPIESGLAAGAVEFVVVDDHSVLIVVEAKQDKWDLGRAQGMLEMYVSHCNNVDAGFPEFHVVYGCVSSGPQWEIFSYAAGKWTYHGRYTSLDVVNKDSIDQVFDVSKVEAFLGIINALLDNALRKVKHASTSSS